MMNSSATYQSFMATVFRGMMFENVLCYIDDILVYSHSWSDHLRHLRQVSTDWDSQIWNCILQYADLDWKKSFTLDIYCLQKEPQLTNGKQLLSMTFHVQRIKKSSLILGTCHIAQKIRLQLLIHCWPINRLLRKGMEFTCDDEWKNLSRC